jgi:PhoH-like ATPase
VIPYSVLEELDQIKFDNRRSRETKYVARRAVRNLVDYNIECKDFNNEYNIADDDLLEISQLDCYKVYTGDLLLVKKGKALNANIELFDPEIDTYTGIVERDLSPKDYNKFIENGNIGWGHEELYHNQFIDFGEVLGQYRDGQVFKVSWNNARKVRDIKELNRRQILAYELLQDQSVTVAVLWGRAGTGKTALATKTAFDFVQKSYYDKVMISSPNVQVTEELGFLPGGIEEKQAPYIQPFADNMESYQLNAQIQPLSTVKGRDIKDTLYIIDEAQDIPPSHMKLLVERIGKGSKVIFTGDVRQIDKAGLTPHYNGITFLTNRLKGQEGFGCIELDEIERSDTAKLGRFLEE